MATAAELVREPRRTDRMIDPGRWSAGENAVGTLFARIARVLAGTYPDDPDLLLRPVFVVVDDIDAHLHPATQQRIVPELMRRFPGMHLLASPHSPMVLTTVLPTQIIGLATEAKAGERHHGMPMNRAGRQSAAHRAVDTPDRQRTASGAAEEGDRRRAAARAERRHDRRARPAAAEAGERLEQPRGNAAPPAAAEAAGGTAETNKDDVPAETA